MFQLNVLKSGHVLHQQSFQALIFPEVAAHGNDLVSMNSFSKRMYLLILNTTKILAPQRVTEKPFASVSVTNHASRSDPV